MSTAALRHYLAPSGITPEQLRSAPRGIRFPLETTHLKYRRNGFATPSGRLEIFSEALQAIGQPPLPEFREPAQSADGDDARRSLPVGADIGQDTALSVTASIAICPACAARCRSRSSR